MHTKELERRFEEEMAAHQALIHKICNMYAYTAADRKDLFQDIVLQLWHAYPKFKRTSSFRTWLYRIGIYTAISGLRNKRNFIAYHDPAELPVQVADKTAFHAEEERYRQLYAAIGQLNEIEKAIVMLYMEDRSYDEMEEILGISSGTLRVKMTRIKEKLRTLTKTMDHGA